MDHIEHILNELYAIDPSLKGREQQVRSLVVALIESRPNISIDNSFVKNLRAELLLRPVPTPQSSSWLVHDFSWWVLRLVPIGAVALLLLMVVPKSQVPTAPSVEINTMSMTQKMSGNSLNVSAQKIGNRIVVDYVSFEQPGFVAVQEDIGGSPGKILGVSKIVHKGRSEGVEVLLSRKTVEGETLYATLYADNGDGIFAAPTDGPVLDSVTGVPMYMLFTVSSDVVLPSASK